MVCLHTGREGTSPCQGPAGCCFSCYLVSEKMILDYSQSLSWSHTAEWWSVLKCRRCRYKSALLCSLSFFEDFVLCSHLTARSKHPHSLESRYESRCVLAAKKTGWTTHTWDLQIDSFLKSGSSFFKLGIMSIKNRGKRWERGGRKRKQCSVKWTIFQAFFDETLSNIQTYRMVLVINSVIFLLDAETLGLVVLGRFWCLGFTKLTIKIRSVRPNS